MPEEQLPHISDECVRQHLDAVLNSQAFASSERTRKFLKFVVEETLAGQADRVKEYTIGLEVFQRGKDYDPRLDPTVRVHAGKLRNKLREYYLTEGSDVHVCIDLVKGSYVPVFRARQTVKEENIQSAPPAPKMGRGIVVGFVVAAGITAAVTLSFLGHRLPSASSSFNWVQLTNFPDSATQPALSPDGRLLAFVRGPGTFVTQGQIYVKALPNGEPVQLTNDSVPKMSPAFSVDSSRLAYTTAPGRRWDTWASQLPGREPRLLLTNAEGLTWINSRDVLFSEIKSGLHMAVVTATENRTQERDVYRPPHDLGMAHFSHLSPDRKWVLIAEMDEFPARWLPCRLVPFDGTSRGIEVGPHPATCTQADWSPDGKWMYFSADAGSGFHLWRQRFGDNRPEQITSGTTEEEGLTVGPDGRWVVTSVGLRQSSVWVHEKSGDRQVSAEGYATSSLWFSTRTPFSVDGKKLYYLVRRVAAQLAVDWELWVADLESGHTERLLPDFLLSDYDIASDGKTVVFAARDEQSNSQRLWLASLDGRFQPRQLSSSSIPEEKPAFGRGDDLFFVATEGPSKFLYRMKTDGSAREKLLATPIVGLLNISPDGEWMVLRVPVQGEALNTVKAYPRRGGPAIQLCDFCQTGWSPGGGFFWITLGGMVGAGGGKTFAFALRSGHMFPALPASGIRSEADVIAIPGARLVHEGLVHLGLDLSTYAYSRQITQRNLYRIPVR